MRENDIKAALIDRLIARGSVCSDAVLINEFAIADKSRRADVVLANGKLHAFEVKSDADKLDRLPGQVEVYRHYFDKVTVVCGEKHADDAVSLLPDNTEVLVLTHGRRGIRWTVAKRGCESVVSDKKKLLSYLPRNEAIRFLRAYGVSCSWKTPRIELDHWVGNVSIKALREAVLVYIKARHAEANAEFFKRRGKSNTKPALLELLRIYRNRSLVEEKTESLEVAICEFSQKMASKHPKAINIETLRRRNGRQSAAPVYIIPKG